MKLTSKASLQIRKPLSEVYEGILNPEHLTKYFISESSGSLESGKEATWKFPEFDETFVIKDVVLDKNKTISFCWDDETVVKISLEAYATENTIVRVTEGDKELTEENLKWLISNTGGWANFLASLKAYLEYGVHLRKGAYEFMKNN